MRNRVTDVVPDVQRFDASGGSTSIPAEPVLLERGGVSADTVELARRLFESALGTDVAVESEGGGAEGAIELDAGAERTRDARGEYRVSVSADGVRVSAPDDVGVHYGCRTVVELLSERGGTPSVPWCEIRDWPDHEWRGLLVDPARGFVPPERLRRLVDKLARAKMNRLHLHLSDAEAYALESESHPELSGGFDGHVPDVDFLRTRVERDDYYSRREIDDLVAYAARRDVELVPEIEAPGHATQFLTAYPDLRCEVADGEASQWSMCIGSERTYEFLAEIMDEVVEQFPGDVVHVGTDEWEFDFSWDECERCQRRMDEEDLDAVQDLFAYFLDRVHGILAERDRRMMIWNETVDRARLSALPDDVIVQFWRFSPDNWEDIEGATMTDFLEAGHDVVSSYVPAAYIDRHATEEYLLGWTPTRRPEIPDEREDQVLGGEMTAWSGWQDESWRAFYRRTLPSAIPVFNNQVWNATPVERDDALYRAVERHVLGPSLADDLPLYDELGGVVLPVDHDRNELRADYASSVGDRSAAGAAAEYRRIRDRLSKHLEDGDPRYPDAVEAYVDCFDWLADVADSERIGDVDRLY